MWIATTLPQLCDKSIGRKMEQDHHAISISNHILLLPLLFMKIMKISQPPSKVKLNNYFWLKISRRWEKNAITDKLEDVSKIFLFFNYFFKKAKKINVQNMKLKKPK